MSSFYILSRSQLAIAKHPPISPGPPGAWQGIVVNDALNQQQAASADSRRRMIAAQDADKDGLSGLQNKWVQVVGAGVQRQTGSTSCGS